MSGESLQSVGESLAAYYAQFAQMAEERERQLGHLVENSPTSADLRGLVENLQRFSTISGSVSVSEADRLMRALAEISDKWVEPESDPIGAQIQPQIEALITDTQKLIGDAMPEVAQNLQEWNSLRLLQQMMRRRIYLRDKIKPKFLSYLVGKWQDRLVSRAFRKQI